ncbi:TetR family transcriptional regulator, partial [Xanthobacter flavus]
MAARPYRQVARESAVRSTEQQIVEAFATLMQTRWFDEVTLDEIAAAAGTTRQTVIRRF